MSSLCQSVQVFQDLDSSIVISIAPSQVKTVRVSTAQVEAIQAQLDAATAANQLSWMVVADGATSPPATVRVINGDTVTLTFGTPIASVGGSIVRASAASLDHAKVLGIVVGAGAPGQFALIRTTAVVEAADWTGAVESGDPLQASTDYYLALTPGKITPTPPTSPGTSIALIGTTISPTQLELRLGFPVLQ